MFFGQILTRLRLCLPDIAKGFGLDPIVELLTATEGDTTHLTCLANIVMYDPPEIYRERADEEDIMLKSNDRLTLEHSKQVVYYTDMTFFVNIV